MMSSFSLSSVFFVCACAKTIQLPFLLHHKHFPAGNNFSLCHNVKISSGAHPASYLMGIGVLSSGVKRPGRETETSSPRTEVKNTWSYTPTTSYVCMAWCYKTLPPLSHTSS
jgi:hypothetical protein